MKCPKCGNDCIGANGGTEWFCRHCWETADTDISMESEPKSKPRPVPILRTETLRKRTDALNATVYAVELELPLPSSKCSPNAANALGHWAVSNKARMDYKQECLRRLPCFSVPLFRRAQIDMVFYLADAEGRYHPRDHGNAISSMKGSIDALVQCGLLPDDSDKYLVSGSVTLFSKQADHKGRACVTVRLVAI